MTKHWNKRLVLKHAACLCVCFVFFFRFPSRMTFNSFPANNLFSLLHFVSVIPLRSAFMNVHISRVLNTVVAEYGFWLQCLVCLRAKSSRTKNISTKMTTKQCTHRIYSGCAHFVESRYISFFILHWVMSLVVVLFFALLCSRDFFSLLLQKCFSVLTCIPY